jgi:hypothetical protein
VAEAVQLRLPVFDELDAHAGRLDMLEGTQLQHSTQIARLQAEVRWLRQVLGIDRR